jgi:hypothetical protein
MPFGRPRDEVLIDALASAVESKVGVVLLVAGSDLTTFYVERARRIACQHIRDNFGAGAEKGLFDLSSNDWLLSLSTGGWLLFYPVDLLQVDYDVRNPKYVYWANSSNVYERISYEEWRRLRAEGHVIRPKVHTSGVDTDGPRTSWDRLLDDELEG